MATAKDNVKEDVAYMQQLGVKGFPTLLLHNGNKLFSIGGSMRMTQLEARLAQANSIDDAGNQHCSIDS